MKQSLRAKTLASLISELRAASRARRAHVARQKLAATTRPPIYCVFHITKCWEQEGWGGWKLVKSSATMKTTNILLTCNLSRNT